MNITNLVQINKNYKRAIARKLFKVQWSLSYKVTSPAIKICPDKRDDL